MSEPASSAHIPSTPRLAHAIYMGTPDFAVPSLRALAQCPQVQIHAVLTQPDKPRGRGMKLQPTPVKTAAEALGFPVFQPTTLKEESFLPILEQWPPLDFIFVVAYGKKIPSYLLKYAKFGCINLHPSLLPRYRGGAPIQRALFNGDTETGVTTMYLDDGWDTGDLILQERVAIPQESDCGQLTEILANQGAALLVRTVEAILSGQAPRIPQDDSQATHEPLLTPEDEWIDWSQSALTIHRRIRGLSPEPAAKTLFRGFILRIHRASILAENPSPSAKPGSVIESSKGAGITIATGEGAIRLEEVQPQGKKRMSVQDFRNGHRVEAGESFSNPPLPE